MSISSFGEYFFCKLTVEIFKYKLQSIKPLHFSGGFVSIRCKGFKSYTEISADLPYLYTET